MIVKYNGTLRQSYIHRQQQHDDYRCLGLIMVLKELKSQHLYRAHALKLL